MAVSSCAFTHEMFHDNLRSQLKPMEYPKGICLLDRTFSCLNPLNPLVQTTSTSPRGSQRRGDPVGCSLDLCRCAQRRRGRFSCGSGRGGGGGT